MTDEERQARIDALTDHERHRLLTYLDGWQPGVIDQALAWLEDRPAAQATEDRPGRSSPAKI